MLAKLLIKIENPLEGLAEKHSLLYMIVFHFLTGIFLITMVSGVAFAGGLVIWMFYKLMGIM